MPAASLLSPRSGLACPGPRFPAPHRAWSAAPATAPPRARLYGPAPGSQSSAYLTVRAHRAHAQQQQQRQQKQRQRPGPRPGPGPGGEGGCGHTGTGTDGGHRQRSRTPGSAGRTASWAPRSTLPGRRAPRPPAAPRPATPPAPLGAELGWRGAPHPAGPLPAGPLCIGRLSKGHPCKDTQKRVCFGARRSSWGSEGARALYTE